MGRLSSLGIDSSNAMHVSYEDSTNANIRYATNASGTWIYKTMIGHGGVSSLAIDSRDAVHIISGSNELEHTTNRSGAWKTEVLDSTGQVGHWSSLVIDSQDAMHISYADRTSGQEALKYLRVCP